MAGLLGAVIALVLILWLFKAGSAKDVEGKAAKFHTDFETSLTPIAAMKAIVAFGTGSGYTVEDINEADHSFVLGDGTSLTSWGAYYHVRIDADAGGNTWVHVDTRPKVGGQMKAALRSSNERCINGIKAALFAAT